jgi:hypothetical protein
MLEAIRAERREAVSERRRVAGKVCGHLGPPGYIAVTEMAADVAARLSDTPPASVGSLFLRVDAAALKLSVGATATGSCLFGSKHGS